jgi:hypothetical protein
LVITNVNALGSACGSAKISLMIRCSSRGGSSPKLAGASSSAIRLAIPASLYPPELTYIATLQLMSNGYQFS